MALKTLVGLKPVLKQEIVDVPEIEDDAQIIVREMSSRRMAIYQKAIKANPEFPVEHMLVACMVDEDGNQIATHDDVLSISEMMPMDVSNRLMEACRNVNESIFTSATAKKK